MKGTKVKINKEENKRNYFNSISSNNNCFAYFSSELV